MNKMEDLFKQMINEPIGVDTDECALWKAEHSKCTDCQYELGCSKYVGLLMVQMQGAMYKPKDFADSIASNKQIAKLMIDVSEAKIKEELDALI